MDTTIGVRGDSLTMGAWDLEKGGRVARLHSYLGNKFLRENDEYGVVYNLGIDGDTSTGIMKRFDIEAEARDPNIIIFAVGANDCTYMKDRTYNVPPDIFRVNIEALIEKAKKRTEKIVIIGLITCDESKMIPIPRIPKRSQDIKGIKMFNDILKDVATKKQIVFIDMLDVINKEDLEDGCHPNAEGHEKMYIRIRDVLLDKKML